LTRKLAEGDYKGHPLISYMEKLGKIKEIMKETSNNSIIPILLML
jgi:hypothetical protein